MGIIGVMAMMKGMIEGGEKRIPNLILIGELVQRNISFFLSFYHLVVLWQLKKDLAIGIEAQVEILEIEIEMTDLVEEGILMICLVEILFEVCLFIVFHCFFFFS